MICDNRPTRRLLISVLIAIAAGCAGGPSKTACADDVERFADVKTSEDEALRLIERIRLTAPTKDEAAVWARVANSKKYSDVRRRRAVLQLFDRHVRPGMTLGDVAVLLAKPSWLKQESMKVSEWVGGESIVVALLQLPPDDGSAVSWRIEPGPMTEDLVYDALQGKKTAATSRKVVSVTVYPDAAEDRAFVTPRDQKRRGGRPRPRHWEIVFAKDDLDLFAWQLDFFGIELGVLTPENKIVYAYHLSKPKPDTCVCDDPRLKERRYYMVGRSSRQTEEKLLGRAGIDAGDSIILQFIPPAIEDQLSDLETGYAGADLKKKLVRTRFGVRATENRFSLYVLEQIQK
jgi:hypothetical protein